MRAALNLMGLSWRVKGDALKDLIRSHPTCARWSNALPNAAGKFSPIGRRLAPLGVRVEGESPQLIEERLEQNAQSIESQKGLKASGEALEDAMAQSDDVCSNEGGPL